MNIKKKKKNRSYHHHPPSPSSQHQVGVWYHGGGGGERNQMKGEIKVLIYTGLDFLTPAHSPKARGPSEMPSRDWEGKSLEFTWRKKCGEIVPLTDCSPPSLTHLITTQPQTPTRQQHIVAVTPEEEGGR